MPLKGFLLNCHAHESGYPETLDSRFHGNDKNYFLT